MDEYVLISSLYLGRKLAIWRGYYRWYWTYNADSIATALEYGGASSRRVTRFASEKSALAYMKRARKKLEGNPPGPMQNLSDREFRQFWQNARPIRISDLLVEGKINAASFAVEEER